MCAVGDGRMGFPEEAPYDAIHVGAAAPTVPQAVCFLWIHFDTKPYLYLNFKGIIHPHIKILPSFTQPASETCSVILSFLFFFGTQFKKIKKNKK